MDHRFYRIQDAADECGVSVSTLRNYERQGLIPPAPRNRAGHRVYTTSDLHEIRRVIIPTPKESQE